METSVEVITKELETVGTKCEGFGPGEDCDRTPVWAVQTRHGHPATPGCIPQTTLHCDEHNRKMHLYLSQLTGYYLICHNCGRGNLKAPHDFFISERPI